MCWSVSERLAQAGNPGSTKRCDPRRFDQRETLRREKAFGVTADTVFRMQLAYDLVQLRDVPTISRSGRWPRLFSGQRF